MAFCPAKRDPPRNPPAPGDHPKGMLFESRDLLAKINLETGDSSAGRFGVKQKSPVPLTACSTANILTRHVK